MTLKGSTLLLLEDEPLLRRRIASHLEKLGAEITTAGTLAEAKQVRTRPRRVPPRPFPSFSFHPSTFNSSATDTAHRDGSPNLPDG